MGILKAQVAFIKRLHLSAGFSVCELGNQFISGKHATPAEAFYKRLGCGRYVSIDGNGRGTITADLNLSLTPWNLGTFDLVTDFGTGEHIFDQAQVWRTMHQLTRCGGYLAVDRPAQGYGRHCFYLVNETLLCDVAAVNQYTVVTVEKHETPRGSLWFGVFRRTSSRDFQVPQQARYVKDLRFGRAVA